MVRESHGVEVKRMNLTNGLFPAWMIGMVITAFPVLYFMLEAYYGLHSALRRTLVREVVAWAIYLIVVVSTASIAIFAVVSGKVPAAEAAFMMAGLLFIVVALGLGVVQLVLTCRYLGYESESDKKKRQIARIMEVRASIVAARNGSKAQSKV